MVVMKLNIYKSPGPDGLHPRVINELTYTISILYILIKAPLTTGSLPKDRKKANMSVIHKKGSKHHAHNYRPVSLTSVVGKILEVIIGNAINKHMLNTVIQLLRVLHYRPVSLTSVVGKILEVIIGNAINKHMLNTVLQLLRVLHV